MEANYVHKDSTTLIHGELVKNEFNQIELQYNALKQQKFNELLKENQELKEKINGVDEERTYLYNKLSAENEQLNSLVNSCQEEIRQLKKQLTTYQILHRDCNIDNLKNISKIEEMENQQKEFIKFLEDNYKETQDIWYIKILQKYKSIIGDDK